MGRQTRGRVTSEGGKPQGSFFEFQEVPPDVLVEVLVEIQHDFRKTSTTVPGSPMRTSSLRTPSPYFRESFSAALSPEIDCAAVGFGGLAFWDVAQSSQCASMLL